MVARTTTKTAAPKSADAKTATKPITRVEPITANVNADEADAATWVQRVRASVDGLMGSVQLPSWTRRIVSTLTALIATASVFYGMLSLLDMLLLAVVSYTGAGFITFLVTFIGLFLAVVAAVTAGSKVYAFAMEFEFSNVKSRIANFFSSKPAAPVAA